MTEPIALGLQELKGANAAQMAYAGSRLSSSASRTGTLTGCSNTDKAGRAPGLGCNGLQKLMHAASIYLNRPCWNSSSGMAHELFPLKRSRDRSRHDTLQALPKLNGKAQQPGIGKNQQGVRATQSTHSGARLAPLYQQVAG